MEDLPRMEAHILDGGHMLLETHAAEAATLIVDFITRTQGVAVPQPPHESAGG
jgi:surfactin synthase thioesterase subunit